MSRNQHCHEIHTRIRNICSFTLIQDAVKGVNNFWNNIKKSLEFKSRLEAVRNAMRAGLLFFARVKKIIMDAVGWGVAKMRRMEPSHDRLRRPSASVSTSVELCPVRTAVVVEGRDVSRALYCTLSFAVFRRKRTCRRYRMLEY